MRAGWRRDRVLSRSAQTLVLIGGIAMVLMTFPGMRQLGRPVGVRRGLGIVGGLAARPCSATHSGLQLALSQRCASTTC